MLAGEQLLQQCLLQNRPIARKFTRPGYIFLFTDECVGYRLGAVFSGDFLELKVRGGAQTTTRNGLSSTRPLPAAGNAW